MTPTSSSGLFTPTADIRVTSYNAAGDSQFAGAIFLEEPFKDIYDCL